MELKDYTNEELRNELKRRIEIKRKEDSIKPRCRNCIHFMEDPKFINFHYCSIRTYIRKGITKNYVVNSSSTCDKFELKSNK